MERGYPCPPRRASGVICVRLLNAQVVNNFFALMRSSEQDARAPQFRIANCGYLC
jgi:hypothetical protein